MLTSHSGRPAPSQSSAAMHTRDVSDAPSATSIYSQPSPDARYDWSRAARPVASSIYPDVSPPSSPGLYSSTGAAQYGDDGDVSPIEDEPELSTPTQTPTSVIRSQIPVPRKVTPGSQAAFSKMRKTSGSQPTRWDKYSGEPTTKPSGQPGQVKPGDPVIPLKPSSARIPQPPQQNNTTNEDAPRVSPVIDRASRFANTGLFVDTRPPWKGASGRHTIVEPVADKPGQAIPIPRRSSKTMISPATSSSNATPSGLQRVPAESETTTVSKWDSANSDDEAIKPPVPLKISSNTPSKSHASPTSPTFRPSGYPSPISPGNEVTGGSTQPGQSHVIIDSSPQYFANRRAIPRQSVDTTRSTYSSRDHPNSRFSWTTYNTDNTDQHSPPPSPPPPVPKMIQSAVSADSQSIMNRTRPVPSSSNFPPPALSSKMSTIRKPVAAPTFDQPKLSPTSSVTPTISKALPRTPQESSASDLIESLNAQLDDLFTQRSNIQKVIRDILETQPQNPLVSDLKSRKEADKKLQGLKDDLAEITRQEHELGLRLHRAYKKRERVEGAAPTALWIRRITG